MPSLAPSVATIFRCGQCPLRQDNSCCVTADSDIEEISNLMVHRKFDSGTEIIHQDEANDIFAFIVEGVVKLTRMLSDGRQQIVGLLTVSDCLGNPFDPTSHDSAECVSDVVLCCFPRHKFAKILQKHPEIEHQLLLRATRDLDEARSWMLSLGQKNAGERIATFLLWLLDKQQHGTIEGSFEMAGPVTIDIPFKRREIGEFLGLTIETVSRQFSKLRAQEAIRISGPHSIEVSDIDVLINLSEEQK